VNLYIHIGTEKTGSSFLQKVCALNREWLRRSGFHFPKAGKHERRLIRGTISPGNAIELAELVGANTWDRVERWLAERITEAKRLSCGNLLLSHELLFSSLGQKEVVKRLNERLERLGVSHAHALLFVRDPVDHAISLYKHRGKGGHIRPIEEWIRVNYPTASELEGIIGVAESGGLQLTLRKYQKNSCALLAAFFVDWLGTGHPPTCPEGLVNPSLTLSEIELLRQLADSRSGDVPLFYHNLLMVPREKKHEDSQLEDMARLTVSNYLASSNDTWQKLDQLVVKDGGLEVPEPNSSALRSNTPYSYSDAQLSAIAKSCSEARTARYNLTMLFDRYLRPSLSKVKKALSW
jgi:hypothetical protein